MALSALEYNSKHSALIEQQIAAFRGFQGAYGSRLPLLLTPIIQGGERIDIRDYISTTFGAFNRPFQAAAAQLSQTFFDTRKQQAATYTNRRFQPADAIDPARLEAMFYNANPVSQITKIISKAQEQGTLDQVGGQLASVASKSVADIERETFIILGEEDPTVEGSTRRARGDGCAFCKLVTANASASDYWAGESMNFHNSCSCIFDAVFDGEPNFTQPWASKVKREADEAAKLIQAGEAGTRTVQVGSREWNSKVSRELAAGARQNRQDQFNGDSRAAGYREYRIEQEGQIQAVLQEMKQKQLSPASQKLLRQWDLQNADELMQPFQKEMTSLTAKNLSTVMEALEGNRTLKNTPDDINKV